MRIGTHDLSILKVTMEVEDQGGDWHRDVRNVGTFGDALTAFKIAQRECRQEWRPNRVTSFRLIGCEQLAVCDTYDVDELQAEAKGGE